MSAEQHHKVGSVCFVTTSPPMLNLLAPAGPAAMGGAELQVLLLGRGLQDRGWEVSYLVGDCGQQPDFHTTEGFRVLRAYRQPESQSARRALFGSLREFRHSLARANADVYISMGLTGQAGVIRAFTRLLGRRYVFWFGKNLDAVYGVPWRSSLPPVERVPAWYALRAADAVVVQSEDQKELLSHHHRREGVVIPNVWPWCESSNQQPPGKHVLWIASLQPKKRPHMLLDLAEQLPHVHFVMAGGQVRQYAELFHSVKTRAEQLANVEFRGFVSFDQTWDLFREAVALVSTSQAEGEGFPNVFLQAWGVGRPVVATCDPDEVISRHGLGYHCQTIAQFVEAISAVTSSADLQQQIGQRARSHVEVHHSEEAVCGGLDALLRRLIPESGPRSEEKATGQP